MSKTKYTTKRKDIAEVLYDLKKDVEDILDALEQIERALDGAACDLEAHQEDEWY